jgi:allantoinase
MSQSKEALSARDRVPYDPIVGPRSFKLPGNARVAVWTIVNVENWLPQTPMPRTVLSPPMGQPALPDVANCAWASGAFLKSSKVGN